MTPEQMANLVPDPQLAAWLTALHARHMWTIRDAVPVDTRKHRMVQQWTIDGSRYFYILLAVSPGQPAGWALMPELGISGRAPAAFAAMERWLAADAAPAIALASESKARQRAAERMMASAPDQRAIDEIRDACEREHARDAISLAEHVFEQVKAHGSVPPLDSEGFTADELAILNASLAGIPHGKEAPGVTSQRLDALRVKVQAMLARAG